MGTQGSNTVITMREEAGPLSLVFQSFLSSMGSATLTWVGFERKVCGEWEPAQLRSVSWVLTVANNIVYKQNRQPLAERGQQWLCISSKRKEGQNYEESSLGIFSTTSSKTFLWYF